MLPLNTHIEQYRVVGFLGMGGMGEVYQAVHTRIDRVVALKILSRTDQDPKFVQRFLNEARIHAGLHHPNIVTLYDFLEFEGHPCIVMEYVDGFTLTDLLRTQGPFPLSEATFIFRHIADAIRYVHEHGVVHRDIKSNNIKISTKNEVKLLDFGIARDANTPMLTQEGNFIGTVQYLAPEQLTGVAAGNQSADIWALGILLYEMVTGHLPFETETVTACFRRINTVSYAPPQTFNPGLPQEVRTIISRCLQKRPAHRYPTARDLLQDTERLAAVVSASTPQLSITTRRWMYGFNMHKWVAILRNQWPLWAAGSALVALIIACVALRWQSTERVPVARESVQRPGSRPAPLPTEEQHPNRQALQQAFVQIHTLVGPADVYQNGRHVATTPWQLEAPVGSHIKAVLKRDGFQDVQINIHVNEHSNEYFYPMAKSHRR